MLGTAAIQAESYRAPVEKLDTPADGQKSMLAEALMRASSTDTGPVVSQSLIRIGKRGFHNLFADQDIALAKLQQHISEELIGTEQGWVKVKINEIELSVYSVSKSVRFISAHEGERVAEALKQIWIPSLLPPQDNEVKFNPKELFIEPHAEDTIDKYWWPETAQFPQTRLVLEVNDDVFSFEKRYESKAYEKFSWCIDRMYLESFAKASGLTLKQEM